VHDAAFVAEYVRSADPPVEGTLLALIDSAAVATGVGAVGVGTGITAADAPFSVTTTLPDAFTLPLSATKMNVNRSALVVAFAGKYATRCNLAAHFADASNPLTVGLDLHSQVVAFLMVARIVTEPPDALTLDLPAAIVPDGAVARAVRTARATSGRARSAAGSPPLTRWLCAAAGLASDSATRT
jgi:hypothetical protein